MWLKSETTHGAERSKLAFEGKLTDRRRCTPKHECMRNPASANGIRGILIRRTQRNIRMAHANFEIVLLQTRYES
jgi:hypothetical protein